MISNVNIKNPHKNMEHNKKQTDLKTPGYMKNIEQNIFIKVDNEVLVNITI